MNEKLMNIMDIIGPVMIGPSSSHTAGAVRLGILAAGILGDRPVCARIGLHGSFGETYKGHGTDRALLAGLMGWLPDDSRIPDAFSYAEACGLQYVYRKVELGAAAHPNTVLFELRSAKGVTCTVKGASLGGGQVRITEIDGFPVELDGKLPAILTVHKDTRGVIAAVTNILAEAGVNIAAMRVFRSNKGGSASMVIECDQTVEREVIDSLAEVEEIRSVRFIGKVL